MRTLWLRRRREWRLASGIVLAILAAVPSLPAADKPTGAPLELSTIETEQPVPLTYLDPDGKTAHCTTIKIHWTPNAEVGPKDDATSFTLDLAPDSPGASIFIAQLWNASLASALAWQQPWQGARWKVLLVPVTDGTGIDAALAVGMIATSARRPYPDKTTVIGSLNPDGSLGPVSHLLERVDAAAAAGMTKVIIPGVQRFDTDAGGQIVNVVKHANDAHLDCVPADNLVEATESVMNDPLPDATPGAAAPRYGNDISSYIDFFAHREQSELEEGMKFAPKEADLAHYPARTSAIWKSIYADYAAGLQAYRAGQVYVAYRLFSRANASTSGVNILIGQNRASFDVKTTLDAADDLRNRLHAIMNPPVIDQGELQSAVLVAEMADWAYDINAELEGAQLVTKQAFSQRTDATDAEKDRARETILFAVEQGKYLLGQVGFFSGLIGHIGKDNPILVDQNAANLLPQLVPAQLATARIFTDGIRQRANDLRDGLLFDPRLVAYVGILRESKANWDARQRKKELDAAAAAVDAAAAAAAAPATSTNTTANPAKPDPAATNVVMNPVKPDANAATGDVAFDPGQTYVPPHSAVAPTLEAKKLSDVALCLIWVNTDCEIATLDEKYLRLNGTVDPVTHEWHVKDRARLDALLQSAEAGARVGLAFAEKAQVDTAVLSMIYERASNLRIREDDASALDALRTYWRCALLGNMCWQLAHARKAQAVDLTTLPPEPEPKKGKGDKKTDAKGKTATVAEKPPAAPKPAEEPKEAPVVASQVPVAPIAHLPPDEGPAASVAVQGDGATVHEPHQAPRALPVIEDPAVAPTQTPTPAPEPIPVPAPAPKAMPAPVASDPEANIPVAPIARVQDYTGEASPTNSAPVVPAAPPVSRPPKDNADGNAGAFP